MLRCKYGRVTGAGFGSWLCENAKAAIHTQPSRSQIPVCSTPISWPCRGWIATMKEGAQLRSVRASLRELPFSQGRRAQLRHQPIYVCSFARTANGQPRTVLARTAVAFGGIVAFCRNVRVSNMRRRELITLLVGIAAWPVVARAQRAGRVHRVGLSVTTPRVSEMVGPDSHACAVRSAPNTC